MSTDADLLSRYARENCDTAFAELVQRHVALVYSTAVRQLGGDAHAAEDVTQTVFTALARKAASLSAHRALAGWLYLSAHHAAAQTVRGEQRRRAREQEAHTMQELTPSSAPPADWDRVRPVLDDVLRELREADREAVLLRFFEQRSFAAIGAALRVREDAARMRVERALGKLHALLAKRGVTSTEAALATALAHQTMVAAPAGLAASVTSVALNAAATAAAGAGSVAAVIAFMHVSKATLTLAAAGALMMGVVVYQTSQARSAEAAFSAAQRHASVAAARFAGLEQSALAAEKERADREAALERRRAEKLAAAPTAAAPLDDVNAKFREIVDELSRNDAELRRAQGVNQRASAKESHRALFASLRLNAEQVEQALDLLVKPAAEARSEFRAAFGEVAGNQLAEHTSPFARAARGVVHELSGKLYYADAPFTPQQAEQLFRLIKDTGTETRLSRLGQEGAHDPWRRSRDWEQIQAQAESFLSAEQMQGLRAFVADQRNKQLLAAAGQEAPVSTP